MHSCQYAFLLLKAGMNISFGCFDRTMTENLFYFVNISALFPKISGERVPEHVGSIQSIKNIAVFLYDIEMKSPVTLV